MKKAIAIVVAVVFILSYAVPLFALPASIEKLYGGTKEVVTSPIELGKAAVDGVKGVDTLHLKPFGLIGGVLKGSISMIHHIVSGTRDIVTFPIK